MSWNEIFRDDFDNGVVDLSTANTDANRRITEAGSLLTIAVDNGTNADWWTGVCNTPVAYKTPLPSVVATRRKRYTIKIDNWTSADADHSQIGLSFLLDGNNAYNLFYRHVSSTPNIQLEQVLAGTGSLYGVFNRNIVWPAAPGAPIYLRVMWCPVHSRVTFYFAQKSTTPIDSDYVFFTSVTTAPFIPSAVALFNKNWAGYVPASSVGFDWIQAEEEDVACSCSVGWNQTYLDDFDDNKLSMNIVNAVEAAPSSFVTAFSDDFDNATLDLTYENHNGLNAEPVATSLIQSATNAVLGTDHWNATFLSPLAYKLFAAYSPATYMLMGEIRLTNLQTNSDNNIYAAITLYRDHSNYYTIGYNFHDPLVWGTKDVAGTSAGMGIGGVGSPNVTPHRYRIYYNATGVSKTIGVDGYVLVTGHIATYYSLNDGASWTRVDDVAYAFAPLAFGITTCGGWGTTPSFSASYDYLKIYQCDTGVPDVLAFSDDFDNATLDLTYENNNGFNKEPGGSWIQSCPTGVSADLWNSVFLNPAAWQSFTGYDPTNYMMAAEGRLTSFIANTTHAWPCLVAYLNHTNYYRFGFMPAASPQRIEVYKSVANVNTYCAASAATSSPNATPHRYRVYYNSTAVTQYVSLDNRTILTGHISFYYSVDDGATWTFIYDEAAGFVPTSFGFFANNGWGDPVPSGFTATWDYLKIYQVYNVGKTIHESGTSLTLDVPNGVNADFWNTIFNAPIAYIDGLPALTPNRRSRYTVKITRFDSTNKGYAYAGFMFWDPTNIPIAGLNDYIGICMHLDVPNECVFIKMLTQVDYYTTAWTGFPTSVGMSTPSPANPLYLRFEYDPISFQIQAYRAQLATPPVDADFKLLGVIPAFAPAIRPSLFVKNWNMLPAAAIDVDYIKAEQHDGTPATRIAASFPSTTFPGLTLGKQWGTHRLTDNANNRIEMRNPGIRFYGKGSVDFDDNPGDVGSSYNDLCGYWRGIRLLGAYCVDDSEWEVDIHRISDLSTFSHERFGIALSIPQYMGSTNISYYYNNTQIDRRITGNLFFCAYRQTIGGSLYVGLFCKINGPMGGFTTIAEAPCASDTVTLKLKRIGACVFEAYYDIGSGPVLLVQTVQKWWADRPLCIDLGYFLAPDLQTWKFDSVWDVTAFRQMSGTYGVNYSLEVPTDDFSDAALPTTKRYWKTGGCFPGLATNYQAVDNSEYLTHLAETSTWGSPLGTSYLHATYLRGWRYSTDVLFNTSKTHGISTPWILFAGDFDIEVGLSLYSDDTQIHDQFFMTLVDACQNEWTKALFDNSTSGILNDPGSRYAVGVRLNRATGLNYAFATKPYNGGRTDVGIAAGSTATANVKITRTGAILRAYYYTGGAWVQIGTDWTDTVNWGQWLRIMFEHQGKNSWNSCTEIVPKVTYIKLNSGDYQIDNDPPYTANIDPVDASIGVAINATVDADILDAGSGVNESTVIIDVDGVAAWSSGTQQVGFVVTESVIASGYRYHVVPNVDFGYNHHGVLRFRAADNTGNSLDQTITFDTVVDISGPIITNKLPTSYSTGVATNAIISLDATDVFSGVNILAFNLDIAGIYDHAVINGIAQTGYSLITTPITNGYNFAISHASIPFPAGITKHISGTLADNIGNTVYFSWFFTTANVPSVVNTIYFSDGYGLKKIEMADLSGESQSQATTLLSVDTVPSIGGNTISSIYGEYVDDYGYYIAFSCKSDLDDYGCYILKDEVPLNQFRDGYYVLEPRINNRGILYLINKDNNTIDVYYGAHFRSGSREPDFVYSISSTPALFDGDILCLHISNDSSLVLNNGTRLYVGTTLGLTRIDAYDEELKDGYSAGSEIYGRSYTYGILGSGASFEVIGGTVAQVSAVAADEQNLMIFVVTNDGNSGGLTQITMEGNRKIVYMTKAGGFLPSNNIKDVFFKN